MPQDNLTKILKEFGERYVEADRQWDVAKIRKRKRDLIKQVIKKVFLTH